MKPKDVGVVSSFVLSLLFLKYFLFFYFYVVINTAALETHLG